ncbi:protein NYNRIN-like [Monomorium pharaonis]|uniref:protein NYNRIN-like n=1 Tax=Monomorium pharaonis TaxID=307658 RepID=UPI00063F0A0B|nr:protein NYNRIN-like [Monomorium pharaonis]
MRTPMNYEELSKAQQSDEELQRFRQQNSGLKMERIKIPGTEVDVWCDMSTPTPRSFLTRPFRRRAFHTVHELAHPGIKATVRSMSQRYVWPSIKKDCRNWARECIPCQRTKVTRHVAAPLKGFDTPSRRFEHVHIDIIILPMSEDKRYCLTCVDRFTRWPEAFPLENQAETVARAFFDGWICRFGVPLRVTTDQERQFESQLFRQLNKLAGATHLRTAAYHPQANGMVERFHRQLKAAIKCHGNDQWTRVLPAVLLGIRAAWKDDLQTTAELVYGEMLRLPGQLLTQCTAEESADDANFIKKLRHRFDELRPPPYDGLFEVVERGDKNFVVRVHGKPVTIAIDRLKLAYIFTEGTGKQASRAETERNKAADETLVGAE